MWLVADRVMREIRARISMGIAATAEAQDTFLHEVSAAQGGKPRNYLVAGDVAEIKVEGLLTEKPDFWAWLMGFGNTTYTDIQGSVALAETDPAIKRVQFRIASPGGTVSGLFDTVAVIDDMKKPRSVVTSFAASAAYALAAVGGKITATNAAVEIGSVGVAIDMFVDEGLVQIANTESPRKRPDVATPEGQAVIREELDALFDILVESIAYGRGTTTKDVRENFGQGGLFVAGEAKRRGMIDRVQRPMLRAVGKRTEASADIEPERTADVIALAINSAVDEIAADVLSRAQKDAPAAGTAAGETGAAAVVANETPVEPAAGGGEQVENTKMDIKQLEKDHPELFAAVLKQGTDAERDRVSAHLELGQQSGDMTTAIEAIKSGAGMTQSITAKYLAAGMRKSQIDARQGASAAADAATRDVAAEPKPKDLTDQVADALTAGLSL
jgi:ClpP class serine protease